jgi:hypothetical protein
MRRYAHRPRDPDEDEDQGKEQDAGTGHRRARDARGLEGPAEQQERHERAADVEGRLETCRPTASGLLDVLGDERLQARLDRARGQDGDQVGRGGEPRSPVRYGQNRQSDERGDRGDRHEGAAIDPAAKIVGDPARERHDDER